MDDQYQQGFERLLSDMDEPPSWEQISTQHGAPTPIPTRGRGLLVAAAAFAVTVVAVGAVILAFQGDSEPTAAPVGEAVDYVEISWTQDVELLCVDMEKVDNDGFGLARVEIWGPNAEGLIRVDATAPDGTVERVITAHPRGYGDGWQVWSSYEDGLGEEETVFRVAGCTDGLPNGASHFRVSDAPITGHGHLFGAFVSIPVERPNGSPIDLLAGLPLELTVRDDTWRDVPVKVVESANAGTASMGAFANNLEVWVDPVRRRYERTQSIGSDEVLGTVVTTTEVIRRGTVPADSVSFSVEDLTLTLDRSTDDSVSITTTSAPSLSADSPWTDQQLSDAANIWVNQTGLNQSDPDVWRSRLDRICDIGPTTVDADTAMSTLADEFIAEDAELSVRADGKLPTSNEAVESLWTVAISPVCLETSLTGSTVPDGIDVAAFDDVESLDAETNRRHALIDDAMAKRDDAERKIQHNQEILETLEAQTDPPASQQLIERQRVIVRVAELEREQAEETLIRLEVIMADLRARHAELVALMDTRAAAERLAAVARAAEYAPYVVEEPIGLEPPLPLPGTDGASGSGCFPGPGDLPDGLWFGYLLERDGLSIDFDLDCMYYGQAAWDKAAASGTDADGDIVFVDYDATIRTLSVADNAGVWMVVGDASEGRLEPFSFANEWTGSESTYASCPGEGCPVWVYINSGTVDAIVQQYLP